MLCIRIASHRETEWPAIQKFKDFIASPYFHEFQAQVREGGYARGPPELKLIDTVDDLASLFGSNRVAEYLVVKPRDTSEVGVQNVLKKLQSGLPQFGASKVVAQSTLNLEPQEIVVLSSYTSDTVSCMADEAPTLYIQSVIYYNSTTEGSWSG